MTRAAAKTTSKEKKLGFKPLFPKAFDKPAKPYRGTNQANIVKKPAKSKLKSEAQAVRPLNMKFPKTPGECADEIFGLDEDISAARAEVARLEKKLSDLRSHTETTFSKGQLTGAIGKRGKIEFIPKIKYNIEDPAALDAFVLKNKALDLFQRRLSDAAIKDRIAAGKKIPGLKEFRFQYMSVKKK